MIEFQDLINNIDYLTSWSSEEFRYFWLYD